ncbi:hypothetical protein RJ640_009559 [Escallonia rubra]|uniref:Protein kinase domain-containing protein n=1 Tax=Escallonia rubra TaxID=112253 RepID=A0AA88SD50_9ASTE|nr:hypothetical protein RJ640_009559 [Escallonia rubra]
MAFDQNTIPTLRPLNVARSVADDSRIASVMSSGGRSTGSPVYYPATVSDAGYVGLGYGSMMPGITSWVPGIPTSMVGAPVNVNATTGYSPSIGARSNGNASDLASDEGGDDSVSGKKVKFLCSYGGKILPRPSDGALRYVGGQTRIISFRRDVGFSEFVQKMVDTYGQNVVVKYQLPDEDLDSLVSVSCKDDLDNMMDEYEKLAERSSDGSAKLRVFLFSASELDSAGVVQLGDLQDGGQKYVEAVNGVGDGVSGGILRKESIASAASTQNSELSGTDAVDSIGHGQGDFTGVPSNGLLSPKDNSTTSQENAPLVVSANPTLGMYVDASGAPMGMPVVRPGPPPMHEFERSMPVTLQQQQQQQQQIGFDLQQPGVTFPLHPHYMQAYTDPHQEILKRADYVQLPSQMGYPSQLVGTVGPMFTRPQAHDNVASVASHQFIPAVHMTMAPSSHVSISPNPGLPLVQPQQVRLERYPDESTLGHRGVELSADQHYNVYPQVLPAAVGGRFGWNQASQPVQMAFSEVPHQPVTFPERSVRFEECYMCQKALPHAHSDTIAQDPKESLATTIPDLNSVYHSLQEENNIRGRPMNRAIVTGPLLDGIVEKEGAWMQQRVFGQINHDAEKPQLEGFGISQNIEGLYKNDATIFQRAVNHEHLKVPHGVVGLPGGLQSTYGFTGVIPQMPQENVVQPIVVPPEYQLKQEAYTKPAYSDTSLVGGLPSQTSDHLVHESPKDYSGKLQGVVQKEDTLESCFTYDHLRHIDGRMEKLQLHAPDVLTENSQSRLPIDNSRKEGILEMRPQQISGRELYLDPTFATADYVKQDEMPPCSSNEVPYSHNRLVESYEVAQPSFLGNPNYLQSKLAIDHFVPIEISCADSAFSAVDSAHIAGKIPPIGEWKDNLSGLQPNMVAKDVEAVPASGNIPASLSPCNMIGELQDSSNSLFSNQDPWNMHHDAHFPPPRPNKILTKKDTFGTRDPFGDNHVNTSGESTASGGLTIEMRLENGVYQPAANMDMNAGLEQVQSSKGSAEELIKQELQAVAEGVAASVLQSSMPSNPDLTAYGVSGSYSEGSRKGSEVETQYSDKFEVVNRNLLCVDISTKTEKAHLGFPVSDGIGRLQIINNSDLEELRELGSGTFGTVYHGKWRGSDVAIKRINDRCFAGKPSEQERMRDDFWNEAIKLADLHHPNVVAFYGVVLDGPGSTVATVTEYMVNGSLRTALQKNERNLDKRKRLIIAMDVAFGMEYLHGKNIVHFDLKSDNLLVNLRDPHRPICKVGDLGLSKVKCQTLISGGVRGTLPWMAPELLNGSSSLVSEKVDVFSFGIVLWELLTGDEPYADLHYGAIIGGIVSNTLRPPVPESCDVEWKSLMERCWSAEPSERPSFTEVANQLRIMATKVPPKGQTQQQLLSTQTQVKS